MTDGHFTRSRGFNASWRARCQITFTFVVLVPFKVQYNIQFMFYQCVVRQSISTVYSINDLSVDLASISPLLINSDYFSCRVVSIILGGVRSEVALA